MAAHCFTGFCTVAAHCSPRAALLLQTASLGIALLLHTTPQMLHIAPQMLHCGCTLLPGCCTLLPGHCTMAIQCSPGAALWLHTAPPAHSSPHTAAAQHSPGAARWLHTAPLHCSCTLFPGCCTVAAHCSLDAALWLHPALRVLHCGCTLIRCINCPMGFSAENLISYISSNQQPAYLSPDEQHSSETAYHDGNDDFNDSIVIS